MAKDEPEKYQEFWQEFGRVLKEGPAEDYANRERIGGLLRFATTATDSDEQTVALDTYIERMKEGQDKIYYITADSPAAARHSPHLEVFRKKGVEVLLLSDRVDEWLVTNLHEYKGKHLQSVTKGELDLGELADKEEKEKTEQAAKEHGDLLKRLKDSLGDKVDEVRASTRLVDSPACIVVGAHDMSANLARVLKAVGQEAPNMKPTLELNLDHPLVKRLESEQDQTRFDDLGLILFDQAQLAEGGQLDDPAAFVGRLNKLMLNMFMTGA
jgi:molecular chaperone HtpG